MTGTFEISAVYLGGLVKGLTLDGTLATVLARLGPDARAAMESPFAKAWWPCEVLEDVMANGFAIMTPEQLTTFTNGTMKRSVGPVLGPVISIALALGGGTPASLFKRLDTAIKSSMRGVTISYAERGPTSGTVRIQYPRPWVPRAVHAWCGALRYAFDAASTKSGRFEALRHVDDGKAFEIDVAWEAGR